jgi:hypothetical protein
MSRIEDTIRCDGCGVEILGAPLVVASYHYCCQDCRDGLECDCAQRAELEDELFEVESSSPSGRYY